MYLPLNFLLHISTGGQRSLYSLLIVWCCTPSSEEFFLFFILESVLYTRTNGYTQVLTHCWKPTHTTCDEDDTVILERNSRMLPQRWHIWHWLKLWHKVSLFLTKFRMPPISRDWEHRNNSVLGCVLWNPRIPQDTTPPKTEVLRCPQSLGFYRLSCGCCGCRQSLGFCRTPKNWGSKGRQAATVQQRSILGSTFIFYGNLLNTVLGRLLETMGHWIEWGRMPDEEWNIYPVSPVSVSVSAYASLSDSLRSV
jgi:hypothetical protein